MANKSIRFRFRFGSYNSGEIAAFSAERAAELVRRGYASYADHRDQNTGATGSAAPARAEAPPPVEPTTDIESPAADPDHADGEAAKRPRRREQRPADGAVEK